jgi:hypothetical protein
MSNGGEDYQKDCGFCGTSITMSKRSGKWAAYEGEGYHQCPNAPSAPAKPKPLAQQHQQMAPPPPARPPAYQEQPLMEKPQTKDQTLKIMILSNTDGLKVEELYNAWAERMDIRYSQYQMVLSPTSGVLHSVCVWYLEK